MLRQSKVIGHSNAFHRETSPIQDNRFKMLYYSKATRHINSSPIKNNTCQISFAGQVTGNRLVEGSKSQSCFANSGQLVAELLCQFRAISRRIASQIQGDQSQRWLTNARQHVTAMLDQSRNTSQRCFTKSRQEVTELFHQLKTTGHRDASLLQGNTSQRCFITWRK